MDQKWYSETPKNNILALKIECDCTTKILERCVDPNFERGGITTRK